MVCPFQQADRETASRPYVDNGLKLLEHSSGTAMEAYRRLMVQYSS